MKSTKEDYFVPLADKSTLQTIPRDDDDQFELPLQEKVQVSPDTFKFIFALPHHEEVLGLPVGGHLFFHFTNSEKEVISRKYTPISKVNERGRVIFLIKLYLPCPEFPEGGQMSKHLN